MVAGLSNIAYIRYKLERLDIHISDLRERVDRLRALILQGKSQSHNIQDVVETLVLVSHCHEDGDIAEFTIRLDQALRTREITPDKYTEAILLMYKSRLPLGYEQKFLHPLFMKYLENMVTGFEEYHITTIAETEAKFTQIHEAITQIIQQGIQDERQKASILGEFQAVLEACNTSLAFIMVCTSIKQCTGPERDVITRLLTRYANTYKMIAQLFRTWGCLAVTLEVPVIELQVEASRYYEQKEINNRAQQYGLRAFYQLLQENHLHLTIDELSLFDLDMLMHCADLRARVNAVFERCLPVNRVLEQGEHPLIPKEQQDLFTPDIMQAKTELAARGILSHCPLYHLFKRYTGGIYAAATDFTVLKQLFMTVISFQDQALQHTRQHAVAEATCLMYKVNAAYQNTPPQGVLSCMEELMQQVNQEVTQLSLAPVHQEVQEDFDIGVLEEALTEYQALGSRLQNWVMRVPTEEQEGLELLNDQDYTKVIKTVSDLLITLVSHEFPKDDSLSEEDQQLHLFYISVRNELQKYAKMPLPELYQARESLRYVLYQAHGLHLMGQLFSIIRTYQEEGDQVVNQALCHLGHIRTLFQRSLVPHERARMFYEALYDALKLFEQGVEAEIAKLKQGKDAGAAAAAMLDSLSIGLSGAGAQQ